MLLSALLESQLEAFAQQGAIDVTHVVMNDVDLRNSALHENQSNTTGTYDHAAKLRTLRPDELRKTIRISYGSNCGFGEKAGTVASALVLWSHAQNVRKRSYACESVDAFTQVRLGRDRHGSCSWPQATCLIALHSTGKNSGCGSRRLPILNRRQFCRGQKSTLE